MDMKLINPLPGLIFLCPPWWTRSIWKGNARPTWRLSCLVLGIIWQQHQQVDGGIMDQMTVVGLATDCGRIVPKDLWAHRSPFANVGFLPSMSSSGSVWRLNRVILFAREPSRGMSLLRLRGKATLRLGWSKKYDPDSWSSSLPGWWWVPSWKWKLWLGIFCSWTNAFLRWSLDVIKVRTIDLDLIKFMINRTILGFRIVHWHGSCSCEETFWQGNLSHQGRGRISSSHIESHLWNILFLAPLNFSPETSSVLSISF